ncbi:MAG: hypothetical protein KDK99_09805 [Verrucomicrobiales bacterium]|nr:hypothetical protein [Verrucomicrobiales bacterium]
MSLKHFHIVFLFFAILCDSGFWLWTRMAPDVAARVGAQGLGMIAGWTSLLLVIYGVWYVTKKCRTIIIG